MGWQAWDHKGKNHLKFCELWLFCWHQLSLRKIHRSKIENIKLISPQIRFSGDFKGNRSSLILLNSLNIGVFFFYINKCMEIWYITLIHLKFNVKLDFDQNSCNFYVTSIGVVLLQLPFTDDFEQILGNWISKFEPPPPLFPILPK